MIDHQDTQIEAKIQAVNQNQYLNSQQKHSRVSVLKSSRLIGKDKSSQTVMSIANTMIGSAIIVYPVLFVKDGMIGSTLIMLVLGCIQYLTCRLLVVHNRPDELLFNQSILRIAGPTMSKINSITNGLLLFFAGTAYFLLVSVNFFQISAALYSAFNASYSPPPINTINFSTYSIQWACILCVFLCLPVVLRKSIEGMLALTKYSVYPVAAYGIFILASLIKQIIMGHIDFSQYVLFDPNFSNVAGAFALSFLIHPTAAPILKRNINLQKNERDLLLGYILTAGIYLFVGFLGGLSCASEVSNINKNPDEYTNIFDCVARHSTTEQTFFYVTGKIVQAGILFQNYSVLPVVFFLARKQAINLTKKPVIFVPYTIFFLLVASLLGILAIDVSIVLSFTGAIIGFIMVYFIPVYIHIKCYHYKFTNNQNKQRRSIISGNLQEDLVLGMQLDEETQNQILKCNDHKPKNKPRHLIMYGTILGVGIAMGLFKILSFFN